MSVLSVSIFFFLIATVINTSDSGVGRRSLMELSGGGSLVTKKGKVQAEREEVSKKTVKMKSKYNKHI